MTYYEIWQLKKYGNVLEPAPRPWWDDVTPGDDENVNYSIAKIDLA